MCEMPQWSLRISTGCARPGAASVSCAGAAWAPTGTSAQPNRAQTCRILMGSPRNLSRQDDSPSRWRAKLGAPGLETYRPACIWHRNRRAFVVKSSRAAAQNDQNPRDGTHKEVQMPEGSTRSWRSKPTDKVTFYPRIFGRRGVVAAEHYSATLAGIEILQRGGNAVDAACAAALVEGVVNPHMHTIGGELPILISVPGSAAVVCINGNMMAPGRATPQAFRDLGHATIPAEGVLAAGVPGTLGAIVE